MYPLFFFYITYVAKKVHPIALNIMTRFINPKIHSALEFFLTLPPYLGHMQKINKHWIQHNFFKNNYKIKQRAEYYIKSLDRAFCWIKKNKVCQINSCFLEKKLFDMICAVRGGGQVQLVLCKWVTVLSISSKRNK